MSIRERLTTSFDADGSPGWTCTTCGKGQLNSWKAQPIIVETARSARGRADDEDGNWEPDYQENRFAGILICNNCGDPVVVAGDAPIEHDPYVRYKTVLEPTYVRPAPHLVPRPRAMPREVERLVERAEEQFWSSPSSAANAIRACVEAILTGLHVPRSRRTKRGAMQRLSLHERIEQGFKPKSPHLAKKMMAVKWLGNAGSHHGDEPTRDDLYDAFDLLTHVIEEIYDHRSRRLDDLASRITKARGPLSLKRQRRKK